MSKKTELKKEIEKIKDLYFYCNESFLVIKELNFKNGDTDYLIDLKSRNTFFTLTNVYYFRILVIKLSKLFLDDERYSIKKLLTKCRISGYFKSIKLDQDYISNQLDFLSSKQEIIKELKKLRDKKIAHSDSNYLSLENNLTLDEIEELLNFVRDFIIYIYLEIFKIDFCENKFAVENSPSCGLKYILRNLDAINNIRVKDNIKKIWGDKSSNIINGLKSSD
jgi:hypothetical protein